MGIPMNGHERFLRTINFQEPDRVITYDLLGNSELIERYGGSGTAIEKNAQVMRTLGINATRGIYDPDRHWLEDKVDLWKRHYGLDPDGWKVTPQGGTSWISQRPFNDLEGLKRNMPQMPKKNEMAQWYVPTLKDIKRVFGEDLVFIGATEGPVTDAFDYTGTALFCELIYDAPDIVEQLLDVTTLWARDLAELYVENAIGPAFFICDDIAYKTGTIFSPKWLREHVYDRWKYIYEPVKKAGFKCFYHSDGDLMGVLDDLVDYVEIDGLNPLEPLAGMDPKIIRDRYPDLIILGNIDSSTVLAHGTPGEVEESVKKLIQDIAPSGGLCAGSSTEIHEGIPLENVHALYDAIKRWGRYPITIN